MEIGVISTARLDTLHMRKRATESRDAQIFLTSIVVQKGEQMLKLQSELP